MLSDAAGLAIGIGYPLFLHYFTSMIFQLIVLGVLLMAVPAAQVYFRRRLEAQRALYGPAMTPLEAPTTLASLPKQPTPRPKALPQSPQQPLTSSEELLDLRIQYQELNERHAQLLNRFDTMEALLKQLVNPHSKPEAAQEELPPALTPTPEAKPETKDVPPPTDEHPPATPQPPKSKPPQQERPLQHLSTEDLLSSKRTKGNPNPPPKPEDAPLEEPNDEPTTENRPQTDSTDRLTAQPPKLDPAARARALAERLRKRNKPPEPPEV